MDDLNVLMSLLGGGIQGGNVPTVITQNGGNPVLFMHGPGSAGRPGTAANQRRTEPSSPGNGSLGAVYSGDMPPMAWIQREQRRNPMQFAATNTSNLDAVRLREEGNKAFGEGKYREAIDLYTRAIQLDPNSEYSYTNRSFAYTRLGDYDNAIKDANEAIRINPNYYKCHYRLGVALMSKGEFHASLDSLRKAASLAPEANKESINVQIAKCESKIARAPVTPLIKSSPATSVQSPLVNPSVGFGGESTDMTHVQVDYDALIESLRTAKDLRTYLELYHDNYEKQKEIVECRERAKRVRDRMSIATSGELAQLKKEACEAQEELRQSVKMEDRKAYLHAKKNRDKAYEKLWSTAHKVEKAISELTQIAVQEKDFYRRFGDDTHRTAETPHEETQTAEQQKENHTVEEVVATTTRDNSAKREVEQGEETHATNEGEHHLPSARSLFEGDNPFDKLLSRRELINHEVEKVRKCVENTNAHSALLQQALAQEAKATQGLKELLREAKELNGRLEDHARSVAKTTEKELSDSRLEALEAISSSVNAVKSEEKTFRESLARGEQLLAEEAELERVRLLQERQRIQLEAEVDWCKVRDEPQNRVIALQNQVKLANERISITNSKQKEIQKQIMEMVDDAHPELAWKSLASGSRILKLIKGSGLWLNLCLSDFQIVSTLSSTINSKVYHATYKGEHVAIKEVGVEDEKQKKRFQREIQIMASCSHPNIIKIKGVFFEGPFAYVLLPFYQKGSVKSLINQGEVFSWLTIQDMFRQVISGVAYLHERGIVHADLKPSNILISSTGQPVIADFGIAKERGVFGELADITVTQTNTGGAAAGTALYMAPEQFLSTPLTPGEHRSTPTATCASDIWALGITLYEWAANNAYALGNKSGPVPTIPTLMPEAPGIPVDPKTVGGDAKLADAIASALVRDPSKRPIAYALLAHPYFSSSLHTAEVSNYTSTLAQSDERLEAVRSFIHAMRRANDAKVLVSVSRNRMVDSLSQIFSNLTEDEVVRPIMAVFQGEAGIDEGALTTEMLNLFYEQLVSEKKALVTGTTAESEVHPAGIVNGATYLPAVDNSLIPREVFELTGKLLLKNILENRAIPLQLNGTVLKYFCDIQPSILDLEEFDSQLGDTFKRLRVLSSEDLAAADLDFSIFSSEFLSRMMEGKYTTHCTVTSENVKDYIDLRVQFDLVECRKSALEAMKKGFFSISALSNHLKLLTPSDLSLLLCGMQHVPPELIISALEFQGFDSSSKTPQHLKEVLKEMNQNNLRRFLQLCTSSAALPANNTMKKIRVLKGADLNRLPVGHGCTNQLDLPDYNDKEVLQAKLSISLAHVSDGFHIV